MINPVFLMRQKASVRHYLGQGVSGPEFSEPEALICRLSFARQLSAGGSTPSEVVAGNGKAYFPPGTRLDARDELYIEGARYVVLSCYPHYDWAGAENHVEVSVR